MARTALAIQNPNFTLGAGAVTPAAMYGGTPLYPLTPVITTLATLPSSDPKLVFTVDFAETYGYMATSYGDIYQINLSTGIGTKIVDNKVGGALGNTSSRVADMRVSRDGTMLYVLTNQYVILTILTSTPYTIATVVGAFNTQGTTDGLGTAARINATTGALVYDATGAYLYLSQAAVWRQIQISNWNVTTLIASGGGMNANCYYLSFGGNLYNGNNGTLNQVNAASGATKVLATGLGGAGAWAWNADWRKPMERCIYGILQGTTALYRYDLNVSSGNWIQVATLPVVMGGLTNRSMAIVNNNLYIMTNTTLVKLVA